MLRLTRIVQAGLLLTLLFAPLTGFSATASGSPAAMETSLLRFANKFYVITLTASNISQSTAAMRKAYPDLIVYQTHVSVAGSRLNFLRLGFFATRAEAEATLSKVRNWYPDAWVAQATPLEQVTALGIDLDTLAQPAPRPAPAAEPSVAPPHAPPRPVTPPAGYALHLDVAAKPQFTPPTLPPALMGYHLYVLRLTGAHGVEYHLNLGVFADRQSAEQARAILLARYPQAVLREIAASEKAQVAALPARRAPSAAAQPPAPSTDDIARRARILLDRAQDQIIAGQYDAAVKTLTGILTLPKNIYTADAIEYTGVAYDRAGQIQQAILHYQVYLRVYPDGPGVSRVSQRLQALQSAPPPATPAAPARPAVAGLHEPHVVGSLSQFYNRGAMHSSVNVPTAGEAPMLVETTQASLATNLNMTSTYRTERYDNRFVLHDAYTYTHAFDEPVGSTIPVYDSTNYLSAAYYETKDRLAGYTARLGRLNGTNWGIFGRYDGAQFIYSLTPGWRVALSAGSPKEYEVDANRKFYGAVVDAGPLANHWFGNLYYVRQDVDGVVDREAVGTELRYADPLHSAFVLFDYDTSYQELNVGVFQLNWRTGGAMTYNLLVDHRLLPTLQTTNAVFGNMNYDESFSNLVESGMSLVDIRKLALDRTVTANSYSAGLSWQLNSKWQLGGDVRLYNISKVPAIDPDPEIPGTGDIYVYTLQTQRSGLFSPKDVTQVGISHKSGDAAEGNAISLSNSTLLGDAWTLNIRLRLSKENTWSNYTDMLTGNLIETSSDTLLISPSLRLSYRIKRSLSLEAEYGYERSKSSTDSYDTVAGTHAYSNPDLALHYYTIGYRWNF